MKKRGFTMIELVFSIVIVGIVILSIPLIVRQSNANTMMSQNVLGYYNALTLMETIKNKPWDRNNIADFISSGEYYILNTGQTATDCKILDKKSDAKIKTKKGLGNANRRRMCDPSSKSALKIQANSRLEAINDFQGYTQKIASNGVDIFQLSVDVNYADINFGNETTAGSLTNVNRITDIKLINVTLMRFLPNQNPETVAVYKYYATNIGSDIPFIKDNRKITP
ncbi:type II secretion system protein [Helicobacter sp. MIT 14-3879]|uniref:type II secretion system protein n=1 Tax=Helicobacter sp. MIT 14-3879 TaxID=2040649 RepID=UPI000E1F3B41|nr:type II secretion system protein [Helicobacter sp. MIT 14-3879]RDU65218.1 hypothetical protein CQA44_02580 [Helicobacter sp. MIT 14-3879]